MTKKQPTAEQHAALVDFAAKHGRTWKETLRDAWMTGHYPTDCNSGALQQVRNTLGPTWLIRWTPTKAARASQALIGRTANIKGGHYAGHWGTITGTDGDRYVISGGSIGDTLGPIFDRDEFTVQGLRARRTDKPAQAEADMWTDEQGIEHSRCSICHDPVSTHDDAGALSFARCGDCGAPTCAAHRDETSAQRCTTCAAKYAAEAAR